jgi:hypothetical protein
MFIEQDEGLGEKSLRQTPETPRTPTEYQQCVDRINSLTEGVADTVVEREYSEYYKQARAVGIVSDDVIL